MDKQGNGLIISLLGIAIGFAGFLVNCSNNGNYQRYESLAVIHVIATNHPKFIYGGKGGDSHYSIFAKGYACRFWIAGGSIDLVRSSDTLTQIIEQLQPGDTLALTIKQTDSAWMQTKDRIISIYGIGMKGQTILQPAAVSLEEKKNRKQNMYFFGACFIAGLCWLTGNFFIMNRRKGKIINAAEKIDIV